MQVWRFDPVPKLKPFRREQEDKPLREILTNPDLAHRRHHEPSIIMPPHTMDVRCLWTWQRMHESPMLNPGRKVFEKDLASRMPRDHLTRIVRPHPVVYPYIINSQWSNNYKLYSRNMDVDIKNLELAQKFARYSAIMRGFLAQTPSLESGPSTLDGVLSIAPSPDYVAMPVPSRPLLRRPVHKMLKALDKRENLPDYVESELSWGRLHETELKVFTSFSLTTLENVEDALDQRSFYQDHFPLLLRVIPCRSGRGKKQGAAPEVYLYHPMQARNTSISIFRNFQIHTPSIASMEQFSPLTVSSILRHIPSNLDDEDAEVKVVLNPEDFIEDKDT